MSPKWGDVYGDGLDEDDEQPLKAAAVAEPAKPVEDGRVNAYLSAQEWQDLRSAYWADVIDLPEAPEGFGNWIADAIVRYSALRPGRRAQVAKSLEGGSRSGGVHRNWAVPGRVLKARDDARQADRETGRACGPQQFTYEALRWAIDESRGRLERDGRRLEPAPARFPKKVK